MHIEFESNPNCQENQEFVFKELGIAGPVWGIRVGEENRETECDVTGVEEGGRWVQAMTVKIADSSDGIAHLIYGGAWGIRLRPAKFRHEPWDLANKNQWGEPFKIYGKREDILYGTNPR